MPGLLCDEELWEELWQAQIAALGGVAAPVVADLTRDDSLDALARRALDAVPGRFALCGLSMAGYPALALVRLAPARVTRLCLVDTSARPDAPVQSRHRRGVADHPRCRPPGAPGSARECDRIAARVAGFGAITPYESRDTA